MTAKAFPRAAALLALAITASARASDGAPADRAEPQFVAMPAISVPIVGSDRMEGTLRFRLVLAAKDAAGKERLTEHLPALRAATIAESMEFARLFASSQAPVDVSRLSASLNTALKTADAGIDRVLIVEVSAVS